MKNRILSVLLTLAMVFSCVPGTALAVQTGNELEMYYDDHLDVSGRGADIVDAGTPTSYQVGYGVDANTPDTAVLTLEGNTLVATGVGTAQVTLDGETYEVTVKPAPISLFLMIGQSNMEGDEGNVDQSIVCPDGQVYSTYVPRKDLTAANAANYVPSALTGTLRDTNVNGTTDGISAHPVYALTEAGAGKEGVDSAFGYQWVQSTGEKVWMVNAAHGGSEIDTWQKGETNYNEAVALFSACQDTLKREIAAGHYTLSHMGYFWNQGCSDDQVEAQWYTDQFLAMHENLKADLSADMDSDPATADNALEFAHLVATLAGGEGRNGYRFGGYENASFGFYSTYEELEMRGHRVSHRWMASNPDLPDIHMISNLGEKMLTMPDQTDAVAEYFAQQYPNGIVDYPVQVRQKASWYHPTTALEFKDTVHYNQIGYNEVGRDMARNTAIRLRYQPDTQEQTKVTFCDWTGYKPASNVQASQMGHSGTLVVPMVEPCYRAKQVTYTLSDGLNYEMFDLLTDAYDTTGTLSAVGADGNTVSVSERISASYRWDMESDTTMVSTGTVENQLERRQGSHTNDSFSYMIYRMSFPIVLEHDEAWALEFKMTGPWDSAIKLFSEDGATNTKNSFAIMANGAADQLAIGYYDGSAYQRWGVALADYGIDLADTHTYRLLNRVNGDSNTIVLFVDGEEIAPMTTNFNTGATSDALSGKDIALRYLGAAGNALNNGTFDYIAVEESSASEQTHFHSFDQWDIISEPNSSTLGEKRGRCTICGEDETRELQGVWQMLGLNAHIQQLPEQVYAQTNLCTVLPDVLGHYKDGLDWSQTRRSVTVEINPGEKIYSNSFGAAGTNGSKDKNGCYLTFWSIYGISKLMDPAEVYAEFSQYGYVTAPNDAVIANVVLWGEDEQYNNVQLIGRPSGYVPQDGDVFFIPGRVLRGCIGEGYVVATENPDLTVGELVHVAVPEDTSGANNTYGGTLGRFWEMTEGALKRIASVPQSPANGNTGPDEYGYHDVINEINGSTITIKSVGGHDGKTDRCGYAFDEACGGITGVSNRGSYEVGPTVTFVEGTSKIIDLRSDVLEGKADAVTTPAQIKDLTDAKHAVINTYVAGAIHTPKTTKSTAAADGIGYDTSTGTVTAFVVLDFSLKYVAEYAQNVGAVTNGTVELSAATGVAGETITVTATPVYGYELKEILVDGVGITGDTYAIRGPHTVTATFTALPRYTVDTITDGNGTVTPDRDWYVSGGTVTVTLMPKGNYTLLDAQPVDEDTTAAIGAAASGDSYELTKLQVNGQDVTNEVKGNKYTFTIEGKTTIQAEFGKKTEEVAIVNENMILGNSLAMNFYVWRDSIDPTKDYYIQVTKTYADGRDDVVQKYDDTAWEVYSEDDRLSRVTFDGLAAKEMNDEITVQVFYADGTAAGPEYTSSPRLYAEKALGYSVLSDWWPMFVDMLNYGASAQQHFGYDMESLANAGLTEEQKTMASGNVTLDTVERSGGANDYFYGSTLYLEHNIALNLYLSNMSAGMYVQVSFTDHDGNGKTRTIAFEDMLESTREGVVYHVASVNELAVADCEAAVTVEVYDADGALVDTGVESVVTYLYGMKELYPADPLYENALKFIASAKENV